MSCLKTLSCCRGNLGFPINKKSKTIYKVMKETFLPCNTFITCLSVKRIKNFRQFQSIVELTAMLNFQLTQKSYKMYKSPKTSFCQILFHLVKWFERNKDMLVSNCCLMPNEQFFSYIMARKNYRYIQ
jgi:hypothetical protein